MKHINSDNKLMLKKQLNLIKNNNIENQKPQNIRFIVLDNIKGLLIFLVVFAHFLLNYSISHKNSIIHLLVNYIYGFHMPLFIFCSGFVSKSENSKSIKTIFKLLIMYLIFNFSHAFILYYYNHQKINFLQPYHSYWYLLSLIYWRLIINFVANQYFSIIISFILSFLIGFSGEKNIISLKRTVSFFPYFLAGYKLSKHNLEDIIKFGDNYYIYIIIIFIIFFPLSFKYISIIEIGHSMMAGNYRTYKEDILIRIKLFIFSFLIISFSLLQISNKKIPLLTTIGKNTLYIYLFHRIITIVIDKEFLHHIESEICIILFSFLFTLFILLTFSSNGLISKTNSFINSIILKYSNN